MSIEKVAVIGGGTMGNGIAHAFALSGFSVILVEARPDLLDKALATIRKNMERQVEKKAVSAEQRDQALSRLSAVLKLEDAAGAQLVVEAIPERMDLKREVFGKLDILCPAETILASNTSSLPITAIAAATKRPDRVIGMHFMNPVPLMKLVEIIRGLATSEATYKTIHDLTLKLGKTPACSQDYPGFIANRILMPMINEACYTLMEGIATKEDIDTVMKLGMNQPMGPLTLADFIGLDVCLAIMEVLHEGFSDSKYRPCPLLRQMVQAGRLGRKTGKGFYDY
jgi:3-hydroxybutyryl-CoA dehydrogenase